MRGPRCLLLGRIIIVLDDEQMMQCIIQNHEILSMTNRSICSAGPTFISLLLEIVACT